MKIVGRLFLCKNNSLYLMTIIPIKIVDFVKKSLYYNF